MPDDAPQQALADLDGLRVATTYPVSTRRASPQHGVEAELVPLSGSVEAAPRLGLADAIVDLVSTGSTMTANGLRRIGRLLESQAVLIAQPRASSAGASCERLELMLDGVVAARRRRYVMMNAPRGGARGDPRASCRHGRAVGDRARRARAGRAPRGRRRGRDLGSAAAAQGRRRERRSSSSRRAADPVRRRGLADALPRVAEIVADVRDRGDAALLDWAERLDGERPDALRVPAGGDRRRRARRRTRGGARARRGGAGVPRAAAPAGRPARAGPRRRDASAGSLPLDSVGVYVPGGKAPLPCSLVMTAVPAQVAGVERIAVATPKPAPAMLATARELGIDEIYALGGAQAIAALAYGTETVPRVDKIVGPGNRWMTAAKLLVSSRVGDRPARRAERGADRRGRHAPTRRCRGRPARPGRARARLRVDPRHAERGARATRCARRRLAQVAVELVRRSTRRSPASDDTRRSTSSCCRRPGARRRAVRNAGTSSSARRPPRSSATTPRRNHVLPTGGLARAAGGLGLEAFLKPVQSCRATREGLDGVRPIVAALAALEGLPLHGAAVEAVPPDDAAPPAPDGFAPYVWAPDGGRGRRARRALVRAGDPLRRERAAAPRRPSGAAGESFARLNDYPEGRIASCARPRRATRASSRSEIVLGAGADDLIFARRAHVPRAGRERWVRRADLSAVPDRQRARGRATVDAPESPRAGRRRRDLGLQPAQPDRRARRAGGDRRARRGLPTRSSSSTRRTSSTGARRRCRSSRSCRTSSCCARFRRRSASRRCGSATRSRRRGRGRRERRRAPAPVSASRGADRAPRRFATPCSTSWRGAERERLRAALDRSGFDALRRGNSVFLDVPTAQLSDGLDAQGRRAAVRGRDPHHPRLPARTTGSRRTRCGPRADRRRGPPSSCGRARRRRCGCRSALDGRRRARSRPASASSTTCSRGSRSTAASTWSVGRRGATWAWTSTTRSRTSSPRSAVRSREALGAA